MRIITRNLLFSGPLLIGAALSPAVSAQEQEKQELKKTDTVPPGGSAGGPTMPDQNAKQEPSSKVDGTTQAVVPVDGKLTAPGAPTDVDTVPSKFSQRTAADDKMPIAAYAFKHLTDE